MNVPLLLKMHGTFSKIILLLQRVYFLVGPMVIRSESDVGILEGIQGILQIL